MSIASTESNDVFYLLGTTYEGDAKWHLKKLCMKCGDQKKGVIGRPLRHRRSPQWMRGGKRVFYLRRGPSVEHKTLQRRSNYRHRQVRVKKPYLSPYSRIFGWSGENGRRIWNRSGEWGGGGQSSMGRRWRRSLRFRVSVNVIWNHHPETFGQLFLNLWPLAQVRLKFRTPTDEKSTAKQLWS